VQTFFGQGGRRSSLDADIRTFGAKTSNVLKYMMDPHGQGGSGFRFQR